MASFDRAIIPVLKHEGVRFRNGKPVQGRTGYVNHPKDPGGKTNFGITQRVARRAGYRGSMRHLPFAWVKPIYKERYWDRLKLDRLPNQSIAMEVFDTSVNCGVGVAGRILQTSLNALNNSGRRYKKITVDGKVGPATIRTVKRCLASAPYMARALFNSLDGLQVAHYTRLVERKPHLKVFYPGWVANRGGSRYRA